MRVWLRLWKTTRKEIRGLRIRGLGGSSPSGRGFDSCGIVPRAAAEFRIPNALAIVVFLISLAGSFALFHTVSRGIAL